MAKITVEQLFDGILRNNGLKDKGTQLNTYYQKKVVYSMTRLVRKIQGDVPDRFISYTDNQEVVKFYFDIMTSLFEGNNNPSRVVVAFAFLLNVMKKYSSDPQSYDRFYHLSLLVLNHQVEPQVQMLGGWVIIYWS